MKLLLGSFRLLKAQPLDSDLPQLAHAGRTSILRQEFLEIKEEIRTAVDRPVDGIPENFIAAVLIPLLQRLENLLDSRYRAREIFFGRKADKDVLHELQCGLELTHVDIRRSTLGRRLNLAKELCAISALLLNVGVRVDRLSWGQRLDRRPHGADWHAILRLLQSRDTEVFWRWVGARDALWTGAPRLARATVKARVSGGIGLHALDAVLWGRDFCGSLLGFPLFGLRLRMLSRQLWC